MRRSLIERGAGQYPLALGFVAGSTAGTTITSDAAAHVKGAWVELGTVPYDATGLALQIGDPSSAVMYLIDVGIGAPGLGAGDPRHIPLPDLYWNCAVVNNMANLDLPLAIPAGQAVYVRMQSSSAGAKTATATVEVRCGGSLRGIPQRYVACGVTPGSTTATQVDPGTTAHTLSAWITLASLGTARRYVSAMLAIFCDTNAAGQRWAIDVARQTAAGEQYLWRQWYWNSSITHRGTLWTPSRRLDLPDENAGTPILVARCQSTSNALPTRRPDVACYLGEAA